MTADSRPPDRWDVREDLEEARAEAAAAGFELDEGEGFLATAYQRDPLAVLAYLFLDLDPDPDLDSDSDLAGAAADGISPAGPTKSKGRGRPATARLAALDERLIRLVRQYKPIGVRGTFYRAEVIGLVPKTEASVDLIQRRLLALRRSGRIPYPWIVDDSREVYGHDRYGDLRDLADDVAALYRRDYWRTAGRWVQVWLEKRTLKGVIAPIVIEKWGLEIYSCNGQLSESLLYRGGTDIKDRGVPTHAYVLSDFDPAGGDIFKAIAHGTKKAPGGIRRFTGGVPVEVEKLALNADQVAAWKLPTRPAKKGDSRSREFIAQHGDISVELEALSPNDLRDLVDRAIERHMPPRQLEALQAIEEEERAADRAALEFEARKREEAARSAREFEAWKRGLPGNDGDDQADDE